MKGVVGYNYADGSENTIRPTGMVYPNGRVLSYGYGDADGIDDRASRIASIIDDDDTHLADYSYLGRQTFVEQDDTQPQMTWTLVDLAGTDDPDTGDIYSGLDRFGRVKDNRWYNYDALADVDRIQYGYDRAGNRIWRRNTVAAALGKEFDEIYVYDGVHRLQEMVRGTLNTERTALTNETFAQCWSLDSTGNWQGFREDTDGNGTWDLVQSRTANAVNEMTEITNTVGSAWASPAYNRAGNMTTMPKPADPTQGYTATYDAWNRLVRIEEDEETVSAYAYDGAKRRIVQISGSGLLSVDTRHFYYTEPSKWQVIEERMGTSPDAAAAERQFVWGLRYIDDLVVRDRDANDNGSLDERLYAMQDANWNVTGIVDNGGGIQERFAYSAYGVPVWMNAEFVSQSAAFDWESLYCGYRYEIVTGLFHVRHRVYQPALGVWVQRDPLYRDTLYKYVHTNPLGLTDFLGLEGFDPSFFPSFGSPGTQCAACHPPQPRYTPPCPGWIFEPQITFVGTAVSNIRMGGESLDYNHSYWGAGWWLFYNLQSTARFSNTMCCCSKTRGMFNVHVNASISIDVSIRHQQSTRLSQVSTLPVRYAAWWAYYGGIVIGSVHSAMDALERVRVFEDNLLGSLEGICELADATGLHQVSLDTFLTGITFTSGNLPLNDIYYREALNLDQEVAIPDFSIGR